MHTTTHLMIKFLLLSLLPLVLADIWGFTPDEPAGTSPNAGVLSFGRMVLFRWDVLRLRLPVLHAIVTRVALRDVGLVEATRTQILRPEPPSTSTSTSRNATAWTSYTTVSYETVMGVTFAYTIVIGAETTVTAGIDMPTGTAIPTADTTVPGVGTPTTTPPKIPTSLKNSTSSTSSRAAAATFTAHFFLDVILLITVYSNTANNCRLGLRSRNPRSLMTALVPTKTSLRYQSSYGALPGVNVQWI
ncbi:hypothetical protein B0J17DRAFT_628763 [Rhizoctonia solani]|nr:hypothetical protein B0J17DRAFT_628763 [Rhizoctonia solani]